MGQKPEKHRQVFTKDWGWEKRTDYKREFLGAKEIILIVTVFLSKFIELFWEHPEPEKSEFYCM